MMKTYRGKRFEGEVIIMVHDDNKPKYDYMLMPEESQQVYNHSPDGFNVGYCGSGCAQTALAILLDCLTKIEACTWYQVFKQDFVAGWKDEWQITEKEIKEWLEKKHLEEKKRTEKDNS